MTCKVCKNTEGHATFKVNEMMFGLRDEFLYFQCPRCECLQLADIPSDMSRYYPNDYYSYSSNSSNSNFLANFLKKERNRYAVFRDRLLGKLLYQLKPEIKLNILGEIPISVNHRILDVGCGDGKLLRSLSQLGFKHLTGVDPYLDEEISYDCGVRLLDKRIQDIEGKQDVIMFHHSFEHLDSPQETLDKVSQLLTDEGHCIIRIPVVPNYAWNQYRENWVQLDAPRHFFLHSKKSMSILARRASLEIIDVVFDSTAFQFYGSEKYKRDIPLKDSRTEKEFLKKTELNRFKKLAVELNSKGTGDACAFILRKML